MTDSPDFGRRSFLKFSATAGILALSGQAFAAGKFLTPISVEDPLKFYPDRDWEKVYRDMYKMDSEFVFLCVPNDTHNCLLKAHVKNDIVIRISPSYGFGNAGDQMENKSTHRWDPRCCNKGLVLARRIYSDRRPKGAMVRKGFKEWADAGFPRTETGLPDKKYFQRGLEPFVKLPWDEAFELSAKAMINISTTYSGENGAALLAKQGYDHDMIESMHGAGVKTMKFRGGMALLGITRVFGEKRFANMLALLDSYVRKVGPDKAVGAKGLDSYTWHTDLAPGTPMTTGHQAMDYDSSTFEHANLIVLWGANILATKMPDSHWVTEARLKGTKVVDITIDYHATANKSDDVIILRPGTDCALALGLAHLLLKEKLYEPAYLKAQTDMPLLVRTDTWNVLKAGDIIKDYKPAELSHHIKILGDDAAKNPIPLPFSSHDRVFVRESLRNEWGDAVVWDTKTKKAVPLSRDECGARWEQKGVDPALNGEFTVTLVDGKKINVVPVFHLVSEYLEEFTPENTSALCSIPKEAIIDLARDLAKHRGKSVLATGAGNNHYFNMHLKDRAILLVAALTNNIGHVGGAAIGNFVGNYRVSLYSGLGQYLVEDPFNIELDPTKMAKLAKYAKDESSHFYNYGDRPLKVGNRNLTDPGHMPNPTKVIWQANSNSSFGNAKGHYDLVINTLPKWELLMYSEWNWSTSCEYSDIVWGVDSWMECKNTDLSASCTNPFLYTLPKTPMKRVYDTKGDMEVYAGVARALAKLTGDQRFADYWKFVGAEGAEVYLQRILNASSTARGYKVADIVAKALTGVPTIMMNRTYPRVSGWEQTNEGKPWYTKTGRLEFYKDDPKLREAGENLPVYREPIDSTKYEPNVIIGRSRALNPASPESYGLERDGNSLTMAENRQGRHVIKTVKELLTTSHPLKKEGFEFCFNTPKYRHGAHTTPIETDIISVWWGPFGDIYRHDKRKPSSGEGFADINPLDAKKYGVDEGDYIWIDGDPADRPYKGWKAGTKEYEMARLMVRARFCGGMQRGTIKIYFNAYGATYGSVEGAKTRADGLAKNPRTNYQAMFRSGSHQSATRAWLNPTLLTDTMVRKDLFGQVIGKGFEVEVHCANGAPKESFVKISKAESGDPDGKVWKIAALGYRPTYENEAMKKYLKGAYITKK
jgi:nitrate reductase alpha subunit